MVVTTKEYIAQRIAHLKELAREKRESEAQTPPLETLIQEENKKYINLDGEELPF